MRAKNTSGRPMFPDTSVKLDSIRRTISTCCDATALAQTESDQNIEAWLSGAVRDSSTGWTAKEMADHVRNEFSTYSWLLDTMLDRTGFRVLERHFRQNAYGAYTCERRAA